MESNYCTEEIEVFKKPKSVNTKCYEMNFQVQELNGSERWLPQRARIISLMVLRNTEDRQVSSVVNQHAHLRLLSSWQVAGQIEPPGGGTGPLHWSLTVGFSEKRTREHRHIPCFDLHLRLRAHTWKITSQKPKCENHDVLWFLFFVFFFFPQMHLIIHRYNWRPMIQNIISETFEEFMLRRAFIW